MTKAVALTGYGDWDDHFPTCKISINADFSPVFLTVQLFNIN